MDNSTAVPTKPWSVSVITFRESLRDIEACLRAHQDKLYHMGIRGGMSGNTLAHANQCRDWRIDAEFAQAMIRIARPTLFEKMPTSVHCLVWRSGVG